MNDLSLRFFLKSSPEFLRVFIDKSGLSWEAKLRKALLHKTTGRARLNKLIEGDLKGLLSRFLGLKEEKRVLLKRFVSALKNIQLLNSLGTEQDRKIFLPIPIQFPNGLFTIGQLLIHLPQKEESSRKGTDKNLFRIVFLLELSNLGPLRADLTIQGKEIQANFLLTKEEAKVRLEENIPIFLTRMRERGFSIHHVECHLKDLEIVNQSPIREIIQEEGHTISLVA